MEFVERQRAKYIRWKARQERKCIVQIKHPKMRIKGKQFQNIAEYPRQGKYVAFFGIPYAIPPVGRLRFCPPRPLPRVVTPSLKPFKAYTSYHPCFQYAGARGYMGSEDCLYLDVYLPNSPAAIPTLLPVLVYIHGDGFEYGPQGKDPFQPEAMIGHGLIFVAVGYRAGLFGFLNMSTKECRGNAGLKDQVLALRWIQANINKFKGDAENITIIGHNAGATYVNLHLISPLSRGLFHKAIVTSGGIYSPWGFKGCTRERRMKHLFKKSDNSTKTDLMANILRYMPFTELMKHCDRISQNHLLLEPRKLVVHTGESEEFIPEGAFLPQKPIELLMRQAKPVPIIAGITLHEAHMYFYNAARYQWLPGEYVKMVQGECFVKLLQQHLSWSEETIRRWEFELTEIYFGGPENLMKMSYNEAQEKIADLLTDLWHFQFYENFKIGRNWHRSAFLYVFEYDNILRNIQYKRVEKKKWISRENGMIGKYNVEARARREEEKMLAQKMDETMKNISSLWAQFCAHGVPRSDNLDIEWKPHSLESPSYLSISTRLIIKPEKLRDFRWSLLKRITALEAKSELILRDLSEMSKTGHDRSG